MRVRARVDALEHLARRFIGGEHHVLARVAYLELLLRACTLVLDLKKRQG
jgi:hypothetical protein